MEYKQTLDAIKNRLDEKQQKKLMIQVLINMIDKTRFLEDQEIERMTESLVRQLTDLDNSQVFVKKQYIKEFNELKKHVRTTHGFIAKGEIPGESMGIGIALGVAIGAAFMSINGGFMGIGIAIGAGIGMTIGASREKTEEDKGNIY